MGVDILKPSDLEGCRLLDFVLRERDAVLATKGQIGDDGLFATRKAWSILRWPRC